DLVPHIEKEVATPPEDTMRLFIAEDLVGKEHHAELAGYSIEFLVLERQGKRIGLKPVNPLIMWLTCRGTIEHWLIEIGCHNARLSRKPRCDGSRERAGPRGRFQYLPRSYRCQSFGQIACIRVEDKGNQKAIIDLRDRPGEESVICHHGTALPYRRSLLRQINALLVRRPVNTLALAR